MPEFKRLTTRKLFEKLKKLDKAVDSLSPDDVYGEEDAFLQVRASMISEWNQLARLLYRRIFSRKIFVHMRFE